MISDPLLLLAFLFAVVAFTRFLEKRFKFVQRISSAVVCTLLGIALANVGVIPTTAASATNATVFEYAIPYAIVLVIIGTNIGEILTAGRPLLVAYVVAVFGSFVGGLACGVLMNAWVGPETWRLSGAFAGGRRGRQSLDRPLPPCSGCAGGGPWTVVPASRPNGRNRTTAVSERKWRGCGCRGQEPAA